MALTDDQRHYLDEKRFAVLGTINRSGSPHLTIMWYVLDGDDIVFNTKVGRTKDSNLARDPRVSLLVYDEGGYKYIRIDGRVRTITSDNGTEFHWYEQIEAVHPVRFYFATPHHSWERGTNENTNGLIRQYLPKGQSMARLTQDQCDAIAHKLNHRPRKRHDYKTPHECFITS